MWFICAFCYQLLLENQCYLHIFYFAKFKTIHVYSEPAGGSCIRKAEATDKTDWLTIIVISGFFINILSSLELGIYDCYLIINFFCDLCLKVLLSFLNLTTDFSKSDLFILKIQAIASLIKKTKTF